MAHTLANLLTHVIFSTKDRQPLLTPDLRTDLLAYMGGIVRNIHGKLIDSNGRPDHVHCLLSLPPALAVAEALRVIKSNSSLWVHETRHRSAFAWQRGYGALQRQPIQRTGGGEVYSRPGAAPPQDFLSGRIHRLPEGAPDPLRRAAYLGVVSAAPTGAVVAVDALPPTAHAVGYSLLPSGLKKESPAFYQKAPTLGLHAKPVTAEM